MRKPESPEIVVNFVNNLTSQFNNQLAYSLEHNIGKIDGWTKENVHSMSLRCALVSVLGSYVEWDILDARTLAAEILQDVNDHGEAAILFDKAKGDLVS